MKDDSDAVAIFWDYENCPAPTNTSGYTMVDNIRSIVQKFGSIKLFKAYLEVSEHHDLPVSKALLLRSELQSSGVSLTDCPHNGRKDVADKMIIVDMLAHAIDNSAPSTIVLISGDRDFAYALSILRLRRYHIVLITLSNAHPSLRAQASFCFDWISEVLGSVDPTFLRQPTSPRRGKTSVPPAHDSFHSDSKGTGLLFQESSASNIDFIDYFRHKANCRESCLTPPKRDFKPDLFPPDLEPSKRQPSRASSTLRTEPDPARVISSPVTSPHHAHLNGPGSFETPLTMPSHDLNSLSSAESTPKLAPYGSIPLSGPARTSLRGASLPNLVLEHAEVGDVTEAVPSKSVMQTLNTVESDLRESFPSSDQRSGYSSLNPKYQSPSIVNQMDDQGNPVLPTAHLHINPPADVTTPHPTSVPTSVPAFMLPSRTTIPLTARSAANPANPPYPPPRPPVPKKFKILVECLKTHRSKGILRPLRSVIGLEIARNGTTYREAGVLRFREYVTMAEKARIIELGGSGGPAWIALMEPWYT